MNLAAQTLEVARAGVGIARTAGQRWMTDQCYRLGAALAYYAFYSLFPLLLLSVSAIGFLLGSGDAARERLASVFSGPSAEARALVDYALQNMQSHRAARGWGALVGGVALLLGASAVFLELQSSLDSIWKTEATSRRGVWPSVMSAVKANALSFGAVFATAVVVVGSLVADTRLGIVANAPAWRAIEAAVSGALLTLLVAAVFRWVPHATLRWRDVLGGALVTSVLLLLLKAALAWYLARMTHYAAYGAVGGVLALLTWIYATSLALFFGAEVARVYAERHGSLVRPFAT